MTITDRFRQQLIGDGVEAVLEHVHNGQRFTTARMFDQVLGQLAVGQGIVNQADYEFPGQRGVDPPLVPYAYCITPGGAYLRQGSANNKVQIAPGTLLQRVTNARITTASGAGGPGVGGPGMDGLEETLLAYTFDGTDELTIANGDAAHPRVDLLQMQLSFVEGDLLSQTYDNATPPAVSLIPQSANTTRRVQCTLSVKQGTPATNPAYPDPDAGCVAVGGVVVGQNYAAAAGLFFADTAGATAVLHDQRVPLCVRGRTVVPRGMEYVRSHVETREIQTGDAITTATGPVLAADGTHWSFGTSVGRLIYPLPVSLGDRIASWDVRVQKTSASGTISARLFKKNAVTLAETALGTGTTNAANNPGAVTLTDSGLGIDVASNLESFYLVVSGGGVGGDDAYLANVTVTQGTGFDESSGAFGENGATLVALDGPATLVVPCPAGAVGRIMAVGLASKGLGISLDAFLATKQLDASGAESITNMIDVVQVGDATGNGFHKRIVPLDGGTSQHHPAAGPTVVASATYGIGAPMWTSGLHVPYEETRLEGQASPFFVLWKGAALNLAVPSGALVGPATWYIAEGL